MQHDAGDDSSGEPRAHAASPPAEPVVFAPPRPAPPLPFPAPGSAVAPAAFPPGLDGAASGTTGPVVAWADPVPPRRRPRRALWITLSVVVVVFVLAAAAAVTTRLLLDARAEALAARSVTTAQQGVVDAEFARIADVSARVQQQAAAYRDARSAWDSEQEQAATWRAGTTMPTASTPNPGGSGMPGADPTGRAFLDSIGAGQVQLVLDAGDDNCGYGGGDGPNTLVVGGCFDTRFPNAVFLAWEPGTEDRVWAIFVHEVMHWYQYQTYYPAFLAAERVGVAGDAYSAQLEADASCRAVYVHGIPAWQYTTTSAPCTVEGWYDGWLIDHLASLGVPVAEPVAETYEVAAVVRP
ncbi:MAG: hypothetical protein K0R60_945 [Microbacterium sp.]|jgi:hypothetical protein|nr:hypothetical protein [Microbacterium sp.]